ncbi:MAG: hypothetical protein LBR60_03700 [Fibrobacter sp.]|jgi:hypothetical protein|nr:hypothetical protein [Fibrobacter sp.]
MKTYSFFAVCIFLLGTFIFVGCDSSSGTEGGIPPENLILDISADTLGFDLGADTLFAFWSHDSLWLTRSLSGGLDSMILNWREAGSNSSDYSNIGAISVANLPKILAITFPASLTADLQLILVKKNGSRMVADTSCRALQDREFLVDISSSSSAPESSSSIGYAVSLSSGNWLGDYEGGNYELLLRESQTFSELINADTADVCVEYTGSWVQSAPNTLSLHRTERRSSQKSVNGLCLNWSVGGAIEEDIAYLVNFMTPDGSNIYFTSPELGTFVLYPPMLSD